MELLHKARNLEHTKLAVVFVGLNIMDAVLTLVLHARGGYELNLTMRYVLEHSPWAFGLVKIGATLAAISLLLSFAKVFPRTMNRVLIASTIMMLGVCIFNAVQLTIV